MRNLAFVIAAGFVTTCLCASTARAQNGGMSSGGFGGGGGGMGGGFGGGTTGLSSGLNQFSSSGSFGQRTMGGGVSAGGNSFGNGQIGMGASGSNAFNNLTNIGTGSNIQQFMSNRGQFVGGATNNSFVGMSPLAGQTGMGMNGMAGMGGMGGNMMQGMRQNGGQNRNNMGMNNGGNQNYQSPIHIAYVADVNYQAAAPAVVETKLANALSTSQAVQSTSPIKVKMDGDTAVITGSVATVHDRSLATQMVMLEPGVNQVRNELGVVPKKKPATELPTPGSAGSNSSR